MKPTEAKPKGSLQFFRDMWEGHEFLRFVVVGVYNALFGLLVFAILQLTLHRYLHYLVILPMAHILAVSNAFIGHKFWTYRMDGHLLADYLRFNVSYLGLLIFGMISMPLLVEGARLQPITANAINLVIGAIASFFLHKYISFRRPRRPSC